ncbi:MAG: DASS family sodium-coupled anion symporter [Xenococcaceae cyanobacterium]
MKIIIKWNYKRLALIGGPLLAAILLIIVRLISLSWEQCWTVAVTTLCAVWWSFEPIPIPATSLIPFAVFPIVGVLSDKEVATAYGHHLILLLLAGFVLSTAIEKSGVHRRLAIGMIRLVGGSGGRTLVLGFMLASALLSMWISNTATTLMLMPVAMAVLEQCKNRRVAVPLLLGVAYGASVGGIGTPVGTPPNVIFMAQYETLTNQTFSFLEWMKLGIPVVLVMLPLMWLWLTRNLCDQSLLELPQIGSWRREEKRVLIVFAMTAVAWVTRTQPFGGWTGLFGTPGVGDSTIALFMVVVMFIVPNGKGGKLLNWKTAEKIPWGLLILFGGGIAIANAFSASGLSESLGQLLSGLSTLPMVLTITGICFFVTFLTEVTSNTATTTLLMPILGTAALGANLEPTLLMVPAALSASCAFMLPVATAPNAIVYGTGKFPISRMMREGLGLNLIGVVVITILCSLLIVD